MRQIITTLSLGFLALMPTAAQDMPLPPMPSPVSIEENTQMAAFRQVSAYFDAVNTLQAGFIQRSADGSQIRGTLSLARPGRVRFDYGVDATSLIVADGKTLIFADYEVGQVKRWPVEDTPLKVLLGSATDLTSAGTTIIPAPNGDENLIAVIASNPEKPKQGEVTLYFRKTDKGAAGLRLESWQVLDAKHQVTTVTLVNHMLNKPLDADLWTFEDPRGIAKRRRTRR